MRPALLNFLLRVVDSENETGPLSDGVVLDLANDFAHVATNSGLSARFDFSMTVAGNRVAIWGGADTSGELANGSFFDPASNSWTSIPTSAQVSARRGHAAFWTGAELIIAGGSRSGQPAGDAHAYHSTDNVWRSLGENLDLPDQAAFSYRSPVLNAVTGIFSGGSFMTSAWSLDANPQIYFYRKQQ